MKLDQDGKKRLAQARQIANGDTSKIRSAVQEAHTGVANGARCGQLKNELERRPRDEAREKERKKHAQKMFPVAGLMVRG